MSDPLLTIVDQMTDEIDLAYAIAVAVEGLKEDGHSPRAITGVEKPAFDLGERLTDLRARIEAIRPMVRMDQQSPRRWADGARLITLDGLRPVTAALRE